jgi:hypothetical protein
MTTEFEQAKRMLYSGENIIAPLQYLELTGKLTPAQRHFLIQESEAIRLSPHQRKEGRRRLHGGRQRRPGGGRKPLVARPEYAAALEKIIVLQSPDSPLAYSTQSTRSIAGAMKLQCTPCSPSSIPSLPGAIGLRVHCHIKLSQRIKSVDPAAQFGFIGRRLEHILSNDTGVALYITADVQPKTPCNCPADRLESWRGQCLATYVQNFLNSQKDNFATKKTDELLLIVEGGGLLGLRNRHLPRLLQFFADETGITVFLSHLPTGLPRTQTDLMAEGKLSLVKDQWKLGTVHIQIGKVKTSFPPSKPQDSNFRPTSWNRIFRPVTLDASNDNQAPTSSNDTQDAAVEDCPSDMQCAAGSRRTPTRPLSTSVPNEPALSPTA